MLRFGKRKQHWSFAHIFRILISEESAQLFFFERNQDTPKPDKENPGSYKDVRGVGQQPPAEHQQYDSKVERMPHILLWATEDQRLCSDYAFAELRPSENFGEGRVRGYDHI